MRSIIIDFDIQINIEEFKKTLSFISADISSFEWNNMQLKLSVFDCADINKIENDIRYSARKFINAENSDEVYFETDSEGEDYVAVDKMSDDNIIVFGKSQIGFGEKGIFLFNYFDNIFEQMALRRNARKKIYPVLLPIGEYVKTGYLAKSPQYAMLCSCMDENMSYMEQMEKDIIARASKDKLKEPEYALSPSACFHTYIEYKNKELKDNTLITFRQNVFRNEGRFNFDEVGRFMDYHVREIVMIGDIEYVTGTRKEIMDESVELVKKLKLTGDMRLASDPFIMPKMQIYKKIQRIDKSKYELNLYTSKEHKISVASYNLHGKAFTDPFNICIEGRDDTVTACVGFGLQRWVVAFVAQYGWDETKWPKDVLDKYHEQIM